MRIDGFIVGSFSDHGRMILGTVSDRSHIVNDVALFLIKFVSDFGRLFFVCLVKLEDENSYSPYATQ